MYLSSVLILKQPTTRGMGADSVAVGHLQLAVALTKPRKDRDSKVHVTAISIVVMRLN